MRLRGVPRGGRAALRGGAEAGQRRHGTASRGTGQPSENAEKGYGLWGDQILPSGMPRTAYWGRFRVPQFDYERKRRGNPVVVGIDLGTSNSCVSFYGEAGPEVVEIRGKRTTPTLIAIQSDHRYYGHEAEERLQLMQGMAMFSGKRLLGRTLLDSRLPRSVYEDQVELCQTPAGVGIRVTRTYTPPHAPWSLKEAPQPKQIVEEYAALHIMGMFLRHLKTAAEDTLGRDVDTACITVPAHFSRAQRKQTEDAAAIAGLNVLEILDEPTSAALAYRELLSARLGDRSGAGKSKVMVFDLGGGTFDVAVQELDFANGTSEIVAHGGDDALGGDDFDRALLGQWRAEIDELKTHGHADMFDQLNRGLEAELLKKAKEVKIALDTAEEHHTSTIVWSGPITTNKVPLTMTRFEYEEVCRPLFDRMTACMESVLAEAGIKPSDIDDVLLVGEMTRTPCILDYIRRTTGCDPFFSDHCSPGTAVSFGAAVRAKQLADLKEGKSVPSFVFDKKSIQYRKTLTGWRALKYDCEEWLRRARQQRRTRLSTNERQQVLRMEEGLPEELLTKLAQDIHENELLMAKRKKCEELTAKAAKLLGQINVWKEPRVGFNDPELDEMLELVKFWNRVVETSKKDEEQLAQALWELEFYFEELAGVNVKTALEEMLEDPSTEHLREDVRVQQVAPVRSARGGSDREGSGDSPAAGSA